MMFTLITFTLIFVLPLYVLGQHYDPNDIAFIRYLIKRSVKKRLFTCLYILNIFRTGTAVIDSITKNM